MSTQWATAEELASIIQRATVDTVSANLVLSAAAQVVRNEVLQDVDLIETTEVHDGPAPTPFYTPDGYDASIIFLDQRPVASITSISELQVGVGSVDLVEGTDFVLGKGGKVRRVKSLGVANWVSYPWTVNEMGISVVYQHGWDTDAREFATAKQISLQAAARAYVNPEMRHQLKIGTYQERYFGTTTPITGLIQLTPFEKLMLNPLRPNWG